MVRSIGSSKHASPKLGIVVCCAALLGTFLVIDVFWASSPRFSSAYVNVASNWSPNNPRPATATATAIYPSKGKDGDGQKKKKQIDGSSGDDNKDGGRVLSATFADLPAPVLKWEKMAPAPVPRLDGAAIQISNLLYVFAGYGTIDYVHSHVDVYNFTDNTWSGRFDMPKKMAHSHLGMVTDGRYIYIVNGQYGPQCRGATTHTFVLDTETKIWSSMPSLPFPRYAPATTLWRGRIHVMGGSKEDRHTTSIDHWSLAVKDGHALESEWHTETPIPRGGPHRSCLVVDDRLYVIGGQEGDFMAKPGSPIFKCSRRNEVVYGDVYMLDNEMKWKQLPSLPKPNSHIEFAWAIVNNSIVLAGGTTEKHPVTKKMVLNGEVFQFNLNTLKWFIIGKLPFRVKTTLVGFWEGWFYFTSGQRDKGPDNPSPKKVIGDMWRTKLELQD